MNLEKYIGIPFDDLGRSLKGCDCWGLVKYFYANEFDILLPEYYLSCVETYNIANKVESELKNCWEKIDVPELGCLVTFKGLFPENPKMITHVGVYVGNGLALHTVESTGSCTIKVNRGFWSSKIDGYYKWKR